MQAHLRFARSSAGRAGVYLAPPPEALGFVRAPATGVTPAQPAQEAEAEEAGAELQDERDAVDDFDFTNYEVLHTDELVRLLEGALYHLHTLPKRLEELKREKKALSVSSSNDNKKQSPAAPLPPGAPAGRWTRPPGARLWNGAA